MTQRLYHEWGIFPRKPANLIQKPSKICIRFKIILISFVFASILFACSQKHSRHLPGQLKPRPMEISRTYRQSCIFASSSHWFISLFVPVMIGQTDYFGFGLRALNWSTPQRDKDETAKKFWVRNGLRKRPEIQF